MTDSIIYILITAAIFIVFGILIGLTTRQDRNQTASLSKAERRFYPVALWYRIVVITLSGIFIWGSYHMYSTRKGMGLDDAWIVAFTPFGFFFISFGIPSLIQAFRSYLKIKDEILYYHNGFWLRRIPLKNLIECTVVSTFIVEVAYRGKPNKQGKSNKRVNISPCYKNSGEWIGVLQKSLISRGRK